jgi:hypothetical protein
MVWPGLDNLYTPGVSTVYVAVLWLFTAHALWHLEHMYMHGAFC